MGRASVYGRGWATGGRKERVVTGGRTERVATGGGKGRGDVLALLELDEVLLAVDDLQRARLCDLADIARVEPPTARRVDRELLVVLLDDLSVWVGIVDEVCTHTQGSSGRLSAVRW